MDSNSRAATADDSNEGMFRDFSRPMNPMTPLAEGAIVEPSEARATTEEANRMDLERKNHLVAVPRPGPAETTDADLVLAVAEGNKAALRAVWDRYITAVRSTLRSCLGRDSAIDDLAQEVFLSFYRSASRIRDPSALRPYLLGAAAKLASAEIRSRTRRNRWYRLFHWSSMAGRAARGPDVDERDALRSLRDVLAKVSDRERQAFVLRYVEDLTPMEVAQALGIPKGTAKRAISEGRRRVMLRAQKEPALVQYLLSSEERL
jgi:RNA polymerase sigma-70 factor (ECF subfamily)